MLNLLKHLRVLARQSFLIFAEVNSFQVYHKSLRRSFYVPACSFAKPVEAPTLTTMHLSDMVSIKTNGTA